MTGIVIPGVPVPKGSKTAQRWTADDVAELRQLLADGRTMTEIATATGRTYAGVSCKASEIGARAQRQDRRKPPRGRGYTKAATLRHMTQLERGSAGVTAYAKAAGWSVEMMVRCFEIHCPDRWVTYLADHSEVPRKECVYCGAVFVPGSGKQRYCTRQCGTTARADHGYFGGRRRSTIGLAERVCQLCERKDVKGLSSHHLIGKENDPDNLSLIALCPGCHQVVTILSGRTFGGDEAAWEALITLVWLRRNGPAIAAGEKTNVEVAPLVTITEYPLDTGH